MAAHFFKNNFIKSIDPVELRQPTLKLEKAHPAAAVPINLKVLRAADARGTLFCSASDRPTEFCPDVDG